MRIIQEKKNKLSYLLVNAPFIVEVHMATPAIVKITMNICMTEKMATMLDFVPPTYIRKQSVDCCL